MRRFRYTPIVHDTYRQAASVLVLRAAGSKPEILLLHKPRKRDAWQLPQGGSEASESIEETALRELSEEAGIRDAVVLGASSEVYQYDFPASFRRFRPDHICGQRIAYIFATVAPDIAIAVDGTEVDAYAWVTIEQLPRYVKRKEYLSLIQRLYEEALVHVRSRA